MKQYRASSKSICDCIAEGSVQPTLMANQGREKLRSLSGPGFQGRAWGMATLLHVERHLSK